MPISALVLAAGLGTRLDPLTRLVAKAAVPLGRQSLIERALGLLGRQGVTDVVVNLHYKPATITRLIGDGCHLGMRIRYSWEQPVLGSAGGPRRALPLLASDPFLIVNGDTLVDVDLTRMLSAHNDMGGDVTMAVVPNPAPRHYNGIVVDAERAIRGFVPKGQADGTWHFVGIQVARKAAFSHVDDGVVSETVAGFYRDLVRDAPGRIRIFPTDAGFLDVGTPADYLEACLSVATDETEAHQADRRAGATVDRSRRTVVWAEAAVPPSASLEDAIVAGPVVLPDGFRARNVIVVPRSVLRPDDHADVTGDLALFRLR